MSGSRLGRGRSLLLPVLLLALLPPLLLACGDDDGDGRGPEVPVDEADVDEVLAAAAASMDEVESFRFRLEHQGGTPEILRGLNMRSAEGEVAGPEQMRMTVTASAIGILDVEVSMVILPDQSWMTNPITGRWERESISLDDVFDPSQGVTGLMRLAGDDARITGGERISGVDTYRLEVSVAADDLDFLVADATSGGVVTVRMWIGMEDPLVHRIDVIGAVGLDEPEGLERRLTLRDFGQDIEILPPR